MKKHLSIAVMSCCCLFFLFHTQSRAEPPSSAIQRQTDVQAIAREKKKAEEAEAARRKAEEAMEQVKRQWRQRAAWEPTEQQKRLPAIKVKRDNTVQKYTFTDLIRADRYLCPGSARAYKTLQVALPLLYKDTVPVKGDFKITYGFSPCTARTYSFFMGDFNTKEYLAIGPDLGKAITIERMSTGKKVTVSYDPSEVRGHNPAAAQVSDKILYAEDGNGMTIHIE